MKKLSIIRYTANTLYSRYVLTYVGTYLPHKTNNEQLRILFLPSETEFKLNKITLTIS